jgi:hypothetical protein
MITLFEQAKMYRILDGTSTVIGSRNTVCMKNAVFCDVAPCSSCVNGRFGGTYRLHLRGRKIRERGTSVSRFALYVYRLFCVAVTKVGVSNRIIKQSVCRIYSHKGSLLFRACVVKFCRNQPSECTFPEDNDRVRLLHKCIKSYEPAEMSAHPPPYNQHSAQDCRHWQGYKNRIWSSGGIQYGFHVLRV